MYDNEYDDSPLDPPPAKANRAKAFLKKISLADDYTNANKIDNGQSEGGVNPKYGSDDSEKKYLRDQYAAQSADWRTEHPDMTMTNSNGEKFSMRQSMPRMRADEALKQIQLLREKIAGDASREHVKAGDAISANESKAKTAGIEAATQAAALANRQKETQMSRDQQQYDLEDGLRKAVTAGKMSAQEARNIHDAEMAKIALSPQDELTMNNLDRIPADLIAGNPSAKAAILAQRLKTMHMPDNVAGPLTKPRVGQSEQDFSDSVEGPTVLNAEYKKLLYAVDDAGTRNAMASTIGGGIDALNSLPGGGTMGNDLNIGGAKPQDIANAKAAVSRLAQKLALTGAASSQQEAVRMLVDKILRDSQVGGTKAGKQVHAELLKMANGMSPTGGQPMPPSGQEYNF